MANYYIQFSEVITHLTQEEEEWLTAELEQDLDSMSEEEATAWCAARVTDVSEITDLNWPGFEWKIRNNDNTSLEWGTYFWVTAGDANMDNLLNLTQRFLRKFRPNELFVIRWAEICDKPRVGAFGGGVWIVGANESIYMNTFEWLQYILKGWPGKKWEDHSQ